MFTVVWDRSVKHNTPTADAESNLCRKQTQEQKYRKLTWGRR